MSMRPVSERDRGWLLDRFQFANDTRYVVARALFELFHDNTTSEWINNDNAWRKRLLLARIFNEYMGALEDFAALVHAVKSREPNGVMYEYVNYDMSDVGRIYATARQWEASPPSLADVLGVSDGDLQALKDAHRLAGDDPEEVITALNQIPQNMARLGDAYLAPFDPSVTSTNVMQAVNPQGRPLRSMQAAHNKIKHGSGLVEDMSRILTLTEDESQVKGSEFTDQLLVLIQSPVPGESKEPLTASMPIRNTWARDMVDTIESVKNMAEALLGTSATLIKEGIWRY